MLILFNLTNILVSPSTTEFNFEVSLFQEDLKDITSMWPLRNKLVYSINYTVLLQDGT